MSAEIAHRLADALAAYGACGSTDYQDGNVGVTFLLLNDKGKRWRKAVTVQAASATPQAVLHLMNVWKAEKLAETSLLEPSETLRYAINIYGLEAVREALKPWPIH